MNIAETKLVAIQFLRAGIGVIETTRDDYLAKKFLSETRRHSNIVKAHEEFSGASKQKPKRRGTV